MLIWFSYYQSCGMMLSKQFALGKIWFFLLINKLFVFTFIILCCINSSMKAVVRDIQKDKATYMITINLS